jgi:D-methionine transport system permease protein
MEANWNLAWQLLPMELWNTIYMVAGATFFALLLGLPLGVILSVTGPGHIRERPLLHKILGALVNIGRSFPFAILIVALIPVTRWIVGTSLGTMASIVPLSIAAAPFVARLVESALNEVDKAVVEAAVVIGSSPWQIVTKVLLSESLPSLIQGLTLTVINLIGYSAMAGLVGGGGLGKVAIQYGYYRFDLFIMGLTVLLIILLVQGTQALGQIASEKIYRKRGIRSHE